MRNLYLVQASNTYVGRGFKAAYLPYAVGHLVAIHRIDEFYSEIKGLLCKMGVEDDIIEELISYQKTVLKLPYKNNYSVDFEYDWTGYFDNAISGNPQSLEKTRIRLSVNNEVHRTNWSDYALEAVWFGVNGITLNPSLESEYI